jgi:phage terminase Nu1 subunit (DNA packaging protein)
VSLLSIRQIAELTGKDQGTIRRGLEGVRFTEGQRGAHLYESRDVLPLIYAGPGYQEQDLDLTKERARLARAQADVTEMQKAEMEGRLIDTGIAISQWQGLVANSRARLLSMPSKIAHLVVGVTHGEAQGIIASAVEEALNELSETGEVEAARLRHSERLQDLESTAEADG